MSFNIIYISIGLSNYWVDGRLYIRGLLFILCFLGFLKYDIVDLNLFIVCLERLFVVILKEIC